MKTSVIIPTYHRPRELRDCLLSILAQTLLPTEVLVIDDGRLEEWPLEREFRDRGVAYRGFRKETPGLTASRNLGVREAAGDVIFFLDDDTTLYPDYLEQVLRVYEADTMREVGAVGGVIANVKPLTWPRRVRHAFDVFFLQSGTREGSILPSGFGVDYGSTPYPLRGPTRVQFLAGGVSSYRREVFDGMSFDESFQGYGLGEDKDFTFRLSKRRRLVVTPFARLDHHEAPQMRYDKRRRGREKVLFQYRFFRDHVRRGWVSWLFLGHALFGYLLARTAIMVLSRDLEESDRVRGVLSAIADILRGRADA